MQGPGALYWGFVPFLIESFPYDITELGTYSQLHDMREEALRKSSPGSKWMAQVPEQVRGHAQVCMCCCKGCVCVSVRVLEFGASILSWHCGLLVGLHHELCGIERQPSSNIG